MTPQAEAVQHPTIEGAWTVTPSQNLIFASKLRAEVHAARLNKEVTK
jgi:hypothetical protein